MSEDRVSITEEHDNSNRLGLAGVFLPHDICRSRPGPKPTYINLHSDPPKREPVCATREHSTPPLCATPSGFIGCVHATLTISHAVVVFSHNGIAEVSGLPEYMASTIKSRTHTSLQRTVLNRHRRDEHDQASLSAQEHLS